MLNCKQRLGDFEIVRLLGKGGMGEVYEAQQFHPSRRVALKVLAPWLAESPDALERFWREAEVPARLDHPNIVRIISTGQTPEGIAYYAMQLVNGFTLADLIRRAAAVDPQPSTVDQPTAPQVVPHRETPVEGVDLTPETPAPPRLTGSELLREYVTDRFCFVARIGAVAARSLAYAHRQGFLHRDIKPSNVMLDQHGHLHLLDFGLTRALTPDGDGTLSGTIRGTPWYMSPEQARGEPLDQRSDIYSLGVMLYELATGGLGPFTASRQNPNAVLAQVKAGQCLPLQTLAPGIPSALAQIIQRAVQFQPRHRYADAADLAADLEAVARRTQPRHLRGTSPSRRRAIVLLGGALAAGILVVLALAVAKPWRSVAEEPGASRVNPTPPDEGPPQPAVPPKLGLVEPSPFARRQRDWNVPLALLRLDNQPQEYCQLSGKGLFKNQRSHLELYSPPESGRTLLALDDDPERRWFQFSIGMRQLLPAPTGVNELGIFFGYRRNRDDPRARSRFFVVQLDENPTPDYPHGRVLLGVARHFEAQGARGVVEDWLRPLPGVHVIGLPESRAPRHLCVRVLDDRILLTVDKSPWLRQEVRLEELRKADVLGPDRLDALGALGIWANNGRGFFHEATVTALPSETGGR
jgi:serine/threonine protein kinase